MMTLMRTTTVVVAALVLSLAGPVNASWTPAELTNTVAWYDASDASTIHTNTAAGRVSQWDDKSGNGYHVQQGTASRQPTTGVRTTNSLNMVYFNGANQLIRSFGTTYAQPSMLFAVVKLDGGNANKWLIDTTSQRILIENDGSKWYLHSGGNGKVTGGAHGQALHIVCGRYDTTTELYQDGSLMNSVDNIGTGGASVMSIGDIASFSKGMTGVIGEILYFGDAPISDDRQKIEGYLAHKWGLEGNLPSDHPYKDAAPGSATPGTLIYVK